MIDVGQVERARVPRTRRIGRLAISVNAAHLGQLPAGKNLDHVTGRDATRQRDSCRNRAKSLHRKHTLHGHAKNAITRPRLGAKRHLLKCRFQLVHSCTGDCGHTVHLGTLQKCALNEVRHVFLGELDQLFVDHVDLRQHDQPALHTDHFEDCQVLTRLRHHAIIGSNDQGDQVDPCRTRNHVADELLVARHIDKPNRAPVRQRHGSEAQVDSHAALLLLFQAIWVDTRERANER